MWSDLAAWLASPSGQRALTDAVLPVVAVLVAAVLAALIARGAIRRLERRLDREALTAAIAGFAEAARRSASPDPDRDSAVRLATEADVRLRFSGRAGADLAAEWALLVALAARGDDTATVRDRLLEWARKPSRARRLFASDLEALRQPEPVQERPDEAPPLAVEREPAERPAAARPAVQRPADEGLIVDQPAAVAAADHRNQPVRQAQRQPEPQPERQPQAEAPEAQPLQPAAAASAKPAWLDDYDDDAHVTRNIPLSTPAPVSASTIRDRGRPGDDIVPT